MSGNYNDLKPMQKKFIVYLVELCQVSKNVLTRKEIDSFAEEYGYLYAPAWIVKDDTRRVDRGVWSVPEITDYIEKNTITDGILQEV